MQQARNSKTVCDFASFVCNNLAKYSQKNMYVHFVRNLLYFIFVKEARGVEGIQNEKQAAVQQVHSKVKSVSAQSNNEHLGLHQLCERHFRPWTVSEVTKRIFFQHRISVRPKLKMTSYEDAIFAAAKAGSTEDVQELLKTPVNWNTKDSLGNTPLHYAAGTPLLSPANATKEYFIECGVHPIAVTGHAEVVKLLAQSKKADFNAQNAVGETPLHKVLLSLCLLLRLICAVWLPGQFYSRPRWRQFFSPLSNLV
jgi:ankyrin repeat protein